MLVTLSGLIDWRRVLTVVKPDTLIRWHRKSSSCSGDGSHGLDNPQQPLLLWRRQSARVWRDATVTIDYSFANVYWQPAPTESRRMAITRGNAVSREVGERAFSCK